MEEELEQLRRENLKLRTRKSESSHRNDSESFTFVGSWLAGGASALPRDLSFFPLKPLRECTLSIFEEKKKKVT